MASRGRFSAAMKETVVQRHEQGVSVAEIAAEIDRSEKGVQKYLDSLTTETVEASE